MGVRPEAVSVSCEFADDGNDGTAHPFPEPLVSILFLSMPLTPSIVRARLVCMFVADGHELGPTRVTGGGECRRGRWVTEIAGDSHGRRWRWNERMMRANSLFSAPRRRSKSTGGRGHKTEPHERRCAQTPLQRLNDERQSEGRRRARWGTGELRNSQTLRSGAVDSEDQRGGEVMNVVYMRYNARAGVVAAPLGPEG